MGFNLFRDIKGSNVLIDPHGKVKLTDFGVGRSLDFTDGSPDLPAYVKKSPNWQAPEVLIQNFYSKPADIWSIGCVVVEMLTGSPPFASQSPYPDEVIKIIQGGSNI
jgi:mitogen-activated protein kinase kinase kinase